MANKNIKKILLKKAGDNFVADIENIENKISQNSSNLETAKQELSNEVKNVDNQLSKLTYNIKYGNKSFRSALVFYAYPTDINQLYEVDLVVPVIGQYDLAVFGRDLSEPTCEARPDTIKIISQLNESYGTEVFGYVPIGCLTPEEDSEIDLSNLTIAEIKTRILSWKEMGAKGIFLDEFGYDYRTTRERQNEIVDFCHENSLQVIANAWVLDHVFGTENYIVEAGKTAQHPGNPNNLECHLTENDYIFFENLMFEATSTTNVKAAVPWDVYKVQEYYEKYYKKFKTQVFIANQIPSKASADVQKELKRCSEIAGAVMQADVVAVSAEFWSSESSKTFYAEPFEIDGVKSRFIAVTESSGSSGYPVKFKSVIGSKEYELVWNASKESDTVYSSTKNYAQVNSNRNYPLNVSAEKLVYQDYEITAKHNFKNGINLNGVTLNGKADGSLTWNNQNIVRSVNGVNADTSGNVQISNLGGAGAITGTIQHATEDKDGLVNLCQDIANNENDRTSAVTPHAVAVYVSAGGRKANDIGIVGRQGFGVSFPDATEDELAAIGMSPMNGTYDKTSDNYGNFMSDNGGVFVYIPHHYVRYGEQTEADYDIYGANVLSVKSHDAYNSEAEANADGYFSPRAFYDGSESVNQQGFFMQKYEPYAKTVGGVIYPYGDGSARGMVNIIPPDMMTRACNLGSDYFVASYFMHQAMDVITLLQGQHSTGTANCAWWKSRGGANYPNRGWSTTNPQLYSHNGQKNGVMGVSNVSWEFCPGVTTSGTSATQGQTKVANNKIYLLKPTVKIKDLTNGFGGSTDAWGTTANLLENYDEFDTTDHFVLTTSRMWYWGNGNNQMYISPVKNGVLDTKARDSFMLIPNSEQSVSSSANTMMGACSSYTNPCTQNLALYVHGQNPSADGIENVFSRAFSLWRVYSYDSKSFRCGAYLRD